MAKVDLFEAEHMEDDDHMEIVFYDEAEVEDLIVGIEIVNYEADIDRA